MKEIGESARADVRAAEKFLEILAKLNLMFIGPCIIVIAEE